jgi:hypothetical protein
MLRRRSREQRKTRHSLRSPGERGQARRLGPGPRRGRRPRPEGAHACSANAPIAGFPPHLPATAIEGHGHLLKTGRSLPPAVRCSRPNTSTSSACRPPSAKRGARRSSFQLSAHAKEGAYLWRSPPRRRADCRSCAPTPGTTPTLRDLRGARARLAHARQVGRVCPAICSPWASDILRTRVLYTIVGGRIVYTRPGARAWRGGALFRPMPEFDHVE